MNYPIWEFRKMSRGEINIDPIEGGSGDVLKLFKKEK